MFVISLIAVLIVPVLVMFIRYNSNVVRYADKVNSTRRENAIYKTDNPIPDKPSIELKFLLVSTGLALFLVVINSYTVIPAGHIGVQVTLGEVNQKTLSEGLHFVNPISNIGQVEVRLVTTKLKEASAGTKDLQAVHTDIVVNYRLDGAKAAHIYKEFGLDLEEKVILPAVNESFKSVTARYTSEELITKRDVVSAQIREELSTKLGKYNVGINDISIVNFAFSNEYQKAIEAKVIATQSKLKAEQDLTRIEVEAKQAIARAEGEAKSIQIQTQAINSQGGASYVQLQAIRKWDGKLPVTMLGSGSTPMINLKQ